MVVGSSVMTLVEEALDRAGFVFSRSLRAIST
jgi:hypothetical protein